MPKNKTFLWKTLTIKHIPENIKRQYLALCALSGDSVQDYTNKLLADHVTRNQHKLGITKPQ